MHGKGRCNPDWIDQVIPARVVVFGCTRTLKLPWLSISHGTGVENKSAANAT
jgi:hypothetical protein